jgi:hypothetical protein
MGEASDATGDQVGGATDDQWGPTLFEIGQPWPWEPEWVAQRGFSWLPDSGVLLMVEDNVTEQMCADMAGPVDMALLASGPLVGLLVRFGEAWGWAETFVWRRPGQGVPDRLLDDGSETPHALFYPVLVDSGTKIVRHMRGFTASAHFTRRLTQEVTDRWTAGATKEEGDAAFEQFVARYPTTNAALKGAFARCHGGD